MLNNTKVVQTKRFEFGKNWQHFLKGLDEDRILEAGRSLIEMLEEDTLAAKTFLDIGSGSGLFSLAARRLGARVISFDIDPESVACTEELKRKYYPNDPNWYIEKGSVLDTHYLGSKGHFDVVYSWGVLHHTGDMWQAFENVVPLVSEKGGKLFLAIYNDQGGASRRWAAIKRFYNRSPAFVKTMVTVSVAVFFECRSALIKMIRFQNPLPFRDWKQKKDDRGMSYWTDLIDWVGGYPFEVAKPEAVFDFFRRNGFILERLKTCGGGYGCNEFLFRRNPRI